MRYATFLAIGIILIFACMSAGADNLRVGLFRQGNDAPQGVCSYGPCTVKYSKGTCRLKSGQLLTIKASPTGLILEGLDRRVISSFVKLIPDKGAGCIKLFPQNMAEIGSYRGWVEIRPRSGRILAVNHIDIEDYLRSVLPSEMPPDWSAQALAAQAIVARSYACASKGRHASEGFDICGLTHCQLYRGMNCEHPQTDAAVRSTAGLMLMHNGKLVPAPYHSTCGGKTTDGLYSGHKPEPFLAPVKDSYKGKVCCFDSPHYTWKGVTSPENIREALRMDGIRIDALISDAKIADTDKSGRAVTIKLVGDKTFSVSGYNLMMAVGRHVGYNRIRSTLFTIRKSGTKLVFTGRGLGHGMGMCQWGARGMAKEGCTYKEILKHYYPKCSIIKVTR